MPSIPSLAEIAEAAHQLTGRIVTTPSLPLTNDRLRPHLPADAHVLMKMELFQQAGSFKSRGVLLAINAMDEAQRRAGVTAVSAGNHALAVSWGARQAGLTAKVVMPKTADAIRVEGCKALGAEVVLADNVKEAFEEVERLRQQEGRTMLHPFESPFMTLGAATCGHELASAALARWGRVDAAIIPIGGGGLMSGMASAFHHLAPDCTIYGVEPEGADATHRSFNAGEPVALEKVATMADSLGAPMALGHSFAINRQLVKSVVRLPEDAFPPAMQALYDALKIIAEPACAATFAALTGPLRDELAGKRVAIIACGSNISLRKFTALTQSPAPS
ncbi:MAG: threonine/serine dehydratase [Pseudomonadota bacterium]